MTGINCALPAAILSALVLISAGDISTNNLDIEQAFKQSSNNPISVLFVANIPHDYLPVY